MEIEKYEVKEELERWNENFILYVVADESGEPYELLKILATEKQIPKFQRIIDREITPYRKKETSGVQVIWDNGFIEKERIFFIVYKKEKSQPFGLYGHNRRTLEQLLESLEQLARKNRQGYLISKKTVFIVETNDELVQQKTLLKYVGLWEIFIELNLFAELESNEKEYIPPYVKRVRKKPKQQDDMYLVGKFFEKYLSKIKYGDKVLEKCFSTEKCIAKEQEEKKQYKNYLIFLEEIRNLEKDETREFIRITTQPEYEEKFVPIIADMNKRCFIEVSSEKSEKKNQIMGYFSSENYSGIFFVDDKETNNHHVFIPYVNKNGSFNIREESDEKVISHGDKVIGLRFVLKAKKNDELSLQNQKPYLLRDNFERVRGKKLSLIESYEQEKNYLKKCIALPESEKEYIEENAFWANYTHYEKKDNKIEFTLGEDRNPADTFWATIEKLATSSKALFVIKQKAGDVYNYEAQTNILTLREPPKNLSVPSIGRLYENIKMEVSQLDKQIKACKEMEKKYDLANPELGKILINPQLLSEANSIDIDYDKVEENLFNKNLKNDESQMYAVAESLATKPLYLIQGPPGTGKTTVIVELVRQLLKENPNNKILVTSQANLAVDNVLERLPKEVSFMRLISEGAVKKELISEKIKPHTYIEKLKTWIEKTKERSEKNLKNKYKQEFKQEAWINLYKRYLRHKKSTSENSFTDFFKEVNKQNNYIREKFTNVKDFEKAKDIFSKELDINFMKEIEMQLDWFAFLENADSNKKDTQSKLNNGSQEINFLTALTKTVNVIGATCIHIASTAYKSFEFRFDYMIMDESSKAYAAEVFVPATLAENLILIGDHKQLPPVVNTSRKVKDKVKEKLEDNGLDLKKEFSESLFEHVIKKLEKNNLTPYVRMLDIQYRMPRQIGHLISKYFYDTKLKNPDVREENFHNYDEEKSHGLILKKDKIDVDGQTMKNSVIFVTTAGQEKPYDNGDVIDRHNKHNVRVIDETLHTLNEIYNKNHQNKFTVGVIAGYRGQVKLINRNIQQKNYKNFIIEKETDEGEIFTEYLIETNTVDAFQGSERDIIIYDVVRSSQGESNIGFLSDPRRVNVAFSRAKRLLIIVGDHEYLLDRAKAYHEENEEPQETFALKEITRELFKQGLIFRTLKEAVQDYEKQ